MVNNTTNAARQNIGKGETVIVLETICRAVKKKNITDGLLLLYFLFVLNTFFLNKHMKDLLEGSTSKNMPKMVKLVI